MEPQMKCAQLCQHCRKINVDSLLPPSEARIKQLRAGIHDHERPRALAPIKDGETADKVTLGSLQDMVERSKACELCALFVHIIMTSGTGKSSESVLKRENLIFRADPDLSYYGTVFAQGEDGNHGFVLRRLSLTGHRVETVADVYDADAFGGDTELYFDHILQTCFPGALSDKRHDPAQPYGARKWQRMIDVSLITQWMSMCANEHGSTCPRGSEYRMSVFRVIDVQQNCIKAFHDVDISKLEYVSLSYVWGGPQALMLLQKNAVALQQPGALQYGSLPGTIQDSMELVRQVGMRYLWVDALCIIQDSPEDKVEQISSMADIYTCTSLTIVAATGNSADSGLPGVTKPRNGFSQREVVVVAPSEGQRGVSLVNCLKEYPESFGEWSARGMEAADFNKWSTRGWCLQEGFLSVRRLTFTKEQLFWTCGSSYCCEESCFEVAGLRLRHFLPSVHKLNLHAGDGGSDRWRTFSQLVDNYTRRELTFDGDAANAFGAIFKTFERQTEAAFLWGLPKPRFELGLLWESNHGVVRRETMLAFSDVQPEEKHRFPSWSWLGWKGQILCNVTQERLEMEKPTIVCFVLKDVRHRIPQHVSATGGKESEVLQSANIVEQSVDSQMVEERTGSSIATLLQAWPPMYLLFFWTTTARLQVKVTATRDPTTFAEYAASSFPKLLDNSGAEVGHLCRTRASQATVDDNNEAEFIEVGRRRDPDLPEDIVPPKVLVLQIRRNVSGIAYRVNYGEVDMSAWEEAQPQRDLIVMA